MSDFKKVLLVAFSLLAILFSTYRLTESPPFWFDEGWYFQTSANLARTGTDGLQFAPGQVEHISTFVTVGYPLIYPMALWMKVFGASVLSARLLMVIFILSFLAAAYALARRRFGSSLALMSMALLVTFPPLYGNGKSMLGEMPGLVFFVLSLLCFDLAKSSSNRKIFWLMLAGTMAGLCIATKPFFVLLLPAIVVAMWMEWRGGTLKMGEAGIMGIFLALPIIVWIQVQFRGGSSLVEVLNYYANPYSVSSMTDMIAANIIRLFTDVGTLFTVIVGTFWIISILIRLRNKVRMSSVEIAAVIFSFLTVLAYLRTAGPFRYLFPAQAVSLIFLPNALAIIYNSLFARFKIQSLNMMVAAVSVAFLCIMGTYQVVFDSWVAEAYSSRKTAFWEDHFSKMPANTSVLFYTTPEVSPFSRSGNYYQYIRLFDRALGEEQARMAKSGIVDKVILTTDTYNSEKETVFKAYEVEQTAYKYSILKRRE